MTENKRFMIEKSSIVEDGFFICDNTGKFSFPTTKDKSELIMYVKQLNELNNENEQLKQSFKEILKDLEVSTFNKELLEKENEQLKRQIGNFEHTKDFVADVCADCKRLEKEKEQLNKSRDELISENRHIKKTIQTMLINERTAIGKSVLKQLWNAIHME